MADHFPSLEIAKDEYDDLAQRYDELLNRLWGLLYPDSPNGWEYPTQVIREVIRDFKELEAYVQANGRIELSYDLRCRLFGYPEPTHKNEII